MESFKVEDIKVPEKIVQKWQNLVDIIAKIINVPSALIMRFDPPFIEVFRSSEIPKNPYKVGDREHLAGLYCETVISTKDKLLIPNALKDKNWDKNPDIKLGMISYLGFPLLWPEGEVFGTICVLDSKENDYSNDFEALMLQFKELVEGHLSLIYRKYDRAEFYKDLFAHDINNILQNILAGIQLSEMELDNPDELENNMKVIKAQIIRGANLVSNIRKLSQLENITNSLKRTEICNILKDSIDYLKTSYPDKKMDIKVELISKQRYIKANEFIRDVFENILINALLHNKSSIPEIDIKISKEQEDSNYYLKISFQDNGIGVEDARKERIFQRGHGKDKSVLGMGLGLALVKKIIDNYNGKIWVEDRVKGDRSKGSIFVLLIPEGD